MGKQCWSNYVTVCGHTTEPTSLASGHLDLHTLSVCPGLPTCCSVPVPSHLPALHLLQRRRARCLAQAGVPQNGLNGPRQQLVHLGHRRRVSTSKLRLHGLPTEMGHSRGRDEWWQTWLAKPAAQWALVTQASCSSEQVAQ